MKKIYKLIFGVITIGTLLISGCGKDSSSDPDPADAFVGSYTYTMTCSAMETQTGTLKVTKTAANKISILPSAGTPTPYTVVGRSIMEGSNQVVELPVSPTSTVTFVETSTGTLSGKVLVINGEWSNSKYVPITFKINATKQ
jgi:hypothetical protein